MAEIDVRGLSCPLPVVKTQQAMEANPREVLKVLVDAGVSRENVSRLAESKGYSVEAAEEGGEYRLTLTPPGK